MKLHSSSDASPRHSPAAHRDIPRRDADSPHGAIEPRPSTPYLAAQRQRIRGLFGQAAHQDRAASEEPRTMAPDAGSPRSGVQRTELRSPIDQGLRVIQARKHKKSRQQKERVKYREESKVSGQDAVQEYLKNLASGRGPHIRAFLNKNARENGGLCAGWVALHRREPEKLIKVWETVSAKVKAWEEAKRENPDTAPADLDGEQERADAVELYLRAHDHFVSENPGRDFERPGPKAKQEAGLEGGSLEDAPLDAGTEHRQMIQYGHFVPALRAVAGRKGEAFVEVYTNEHEAQVQFVDGKVVSVCETEKAGIVRTPHEGYVESILTSAFFERGESEDNVVYVTMIRHGRLP